MRTYDDIIKDIHKRNESLINNFGVWLRASGLGEKTIHKHVENISFFINEYLAYQDISTNANETTLCNPEDGLDLVDDFLGYWFIKKAMWSSESSIKSNITSIKKFYTFMQRLKLISKDDLKSLNEEIKTNKDKWIEEVNRYNDIDADFY